MKVSPLLTRQGIEEYEKNALNFVSEYLNSYITDILSDSKQYAFFAERNKINIEDIK
jgi:histone H3/H4